LKISYKLKVFVLVYSNTFFGSIFLLIFAFAYFSKVFPFVFIFAPKKAQIYISGLLKVKINEIVHLGAISPYLVEHGIDDSAKPTSLYKVKKSFKYLHIISKTRRTFFPLPSLTFD